MRYSDQVIRMTQSATEHLFRTARTMPQDKFAWKVLDTGRSALDLLQECAQSPLWFAPMLEHQSAPASFSEADAEAARKQRTAWKTLDACEKVCKEHSKALHQAVRNFPEADWKKEIKLPFGENFVASMADIALFQYWNLVYHTGQINFIQTLYGDMEMR